MCREQYFTLSGLKTNIESVKGVGAFGLFMLVLFLAVAGKMIGYACDVDPQTTLLPELACSASTGVLCL